MQSRVGEPPPRSEGPSAASSRERAPHGHVLCATGRSRHAFDAAVGEQDGRVLGVPDAEQVLSAHRFPTDSMGSPGVP